MISLQILTFITSHAKCALTSQPEGDGAPACVLWFTLCEWPELDMKGWTHFSSWRLWFTCNAVPNLQAPSSAIRLYLRLQNVREQEMRGTSTELFTLCKVYLVSVPHYWDTLSTLGVSLLVSEVEPCTQCVCFSATGDTEGRKRRDDGKGLALYGPQKAGGKAGGGNKDERSTKCGHDWRRGRTIPSVATVTVR